MKALLGCVLVLAAHAVAQESIPTELVWSAPEQCIDASALAHRLDEQLGREAFVAEGAELQLVGTITALDDGRYRAELELRGVHGGTYGHRAIESDTDDCHTLDDPLDVVLQVMLDVRRDELALLEESPLPHGPSWIGALGVSTALVLGLLPGAAFEIASSFTLELPSVIAMGIELAYDWSDTASAPPGQAQAQSASVRALAGPMLRFDSVEITIPLSIEIGAMWASASGFDENRSATDVLLAVRGGLRVSIRVIGPLFLSLRAEVGLLPLRPTFRARDADGTIRPIFEPLAVLGAFGGGLGLFFE
jgi:hypothetical protein